MLTILVIKNSYLTVSSENEVLLEGLYEALSFQDTSKAYAFGSFDKTKIVVVRFAKYEKDMDVPTLRIPIGFLSFVESVLEDFEHSTVDDRPDINDLKYLDTKIELKDIQLYSHQKNAVKTALKNRRGIIMSPTGSGKTEIFLAMLKMLKDPTLVVFNRTQLAHQTMERAQGRGIDAGIVQGKNVLEKHVTMATIQSIEKLDNIRQYKNLILDEVHNAGSKSYQNILKRKHWYRIFGFSATPVNPNKMDLRSAKIIANVGPVVYEAKSKELMEAGIIAKPTIYMIPIHQPDDIEDFDYREAEVSGIVHNSYRNNIVKAITEFHGKDQILILTKYVDQGREIQKLIPEAPFIWNEVKVKDRMKIVSDFDAGSIPVLIASRILDEGIDIKNFKVLIVASAGAAFTKTIQRLGRGLRVTENKKTVTVYDFIDNTQRNLYKHSLQRMRDYKTYGYDNIIKLEEWK